MDSSVTSSRARVAALTRHRPADDPEIEQARQALIRDRDTDRARRALGRLKPEDRAQLLMNEGAPARV